MTTSLSQTTSPRNARRAAAYAAGRHDGARAVQEAVSSETAALNDRHWASFRTVTSDDLRAAPDFYGQAARKVAATCTADGFEAAAINAGAHACDDDGKRDRTSYYRGYLAGARQALAVLE